MSEGMQGASRNADNFAAARKSIATCRSCEAPILWAKTAKTGKAIPLNPEPVPADTPGALVIINGAAYGKTAIDRIGTIGASWYVSHFATCPNAAKHRRGMPPKQTSRSEDSPPITGVLPYEEPR